MVLYIDDLSIDTNSWTYTSNLTNLYLNVIDTDCDINTDNSYFYIGSEVLDTQWDNHTASCELPTISGITTIVFHAENMCSGIAEREFKFITGYRVSYNDYIDWGPSRNVDILVEVANFSLCPTTSTFATYFQTRDLESRDLVSTINIVNHIDLFGTIESNGKYFEYGKTYIVTVSGIKDYSGNILAPYTFNFTIRGK